jgi:hypothetical protein
MAYGDIGGTVTELAITCKSPDSGTVQIAKGDAVKLTGGYTVDNVTADQDPVFGQALAEADGNGQAIPVKVRGVCVFEYTGSTAPTVDGVKGVVASDTHGKVVAPVSGNGVGRNVKVDTGANKVHVLL